jgi:hypothetical protein
MGWGTGSCVAFAPLIVKDGNVPENRGKRRTAIFSTLHARLAAISAGMKIFSLRHAPGVTESEVNAA